MSKPTSSQASKQSNLFGFFTKASQPKPAPSSTAAPRAKASAIPATPSATSAESPAVASGSSSNVKPNATRVNKPLQTQRAAALPAIELSSDGFDEYDASRTAGSSKLNTAKRPEVKEKARPTPPYTSDGDNESRGHASGSVSRASSDRASGTPMTAISDFDDDMQLDDDDDDDAPVQRKLKRSKASVILSDEDDSEEEGLQRPKKAAKTATNNKAKTAAQNKKGKGRADSPAYVDLDDNESQDEYGDGGIDWDAAVVSDKVEAAAPKKAQKKAAGKVTGSSRPSLVSALSSC